MPEHWIKNIYLVTFLMATLIRTVSTWHKQRLTMKVRVKDPVDSLLLALSGIGMALPFVYFFTPWLNFANYPLTPLLHTLGVVCIVPFPYILFLSHAGLGKNWTPSYGILARHEFVDKGIFAWVRHPMYLAHLMWGLGLAFLIPNFIAGPFLLVAVLLLCAYRIPREEARLVATFGSVYEQYQERVGKLFPNIFS